MENIQLNNKQPSSSCRLADDFCVFNGFQFPLLPGMIYMMDGKPGLRVLHIVDETEKILISFEQGMSCLDIPSQNDERESIYSEYRMDNKYLHQRKMLSVDEKRLKDWIGFRMEITDDDGTVHICPGQLSLSPTLRQMDGVEPILVMLLNGFAVYNTKGGG